METRKAQTLSRLDAQIDKLVRAPPRPSLELLSASRRRRHPRSSPPQASSGVLASSMSPEASLDSTQGPDPALARALAEVEELKQALAKSQAENKKLT